jgi:hypothetical protein
MSDSTFTRSMMIHFKGDTIHKLIFVYYLDWGSLPVWMAILRNSPVKTVQGTA